VSVYDPDVVASELVGANREYVSREVPHVWSMMRKSVDEIVGDCDLIVVGNSNKAFADVMERLRPGQVLVDLVRIERKPRADVEYVGICW